MAQACHRPRRAIYPQSSTPLLSPNLVPRARVPIMAAAGESDWKNDEDLKLDLQDYVRRNFQRLEILDFIKQKYPIYTWSLRSLSRRMNHFDIKYINYEVDVGEVEDAVRKEMDGPG